MKDAGVLLIRYVRALISFSPWKISGLLLASGLNGFTQGIGFFMLIPLLAMFNIGTGQGSGPSHKIGVWLESFFHWLNIPVSLVSLLLVFFVLMAFTALLRYWQTVMTQHVQRTYISHLQTRLFYAVLHAQWGFTADRKASHITHTLTHDLPVVSNGSFFFLQILSGLVLAVWYVFWAAGISIHLTGLALAVAGLVFFLFRSYFPRAFQTGRFMRRARANIFTVLINHLSGAKLAKSYGAEDREYERFKQSTDRMSGESIAIARQNARMQISFQLLSNLVLCFILYYALEVLGLPLVEVGIAVLIFSRLVPLLSKMQTQGQRLVFMLPSFEATENLYRDAMAHAENLGAGLPGKPHKLAKNICLKDVSYAHRTENNEDGFSIRNLSLEIPAFRITAVTGESGAGKSTLADLVSGMLMPDSGAVRVDGVPISRENLPAWRQMVGYVPQEVFLFHGTIRENVLMGNPDASDQDIARALELASADAFVSRLPRGLDTVIKERGTRLSGGERQRIALARTLVRNPRLLILDEATSSLDRKNETLIFNALSKLRGRITILFISHGLETLAHADQVIHLEKGKRSYTLPEERHPGQPVIAGSVGNGDIARH